MGADETANKKRRKKSNKHNNHSRKTPVWFKKDTGGKMFVGHLWAFSPRIMMMMTIAA